MSDTAPGMTTQEKLLRAALHLFTTQGFHATPTAQISREAGVSTGTLFHHFRDKETLINELYLGIKKSMAQALRESDDKTLPVKERINRGLVAYIMWGLSNPEERDFLDIFYHSPNICDEVKKKAYEDFLWIGDLFEEAVRGGIIVEVPGEILPAMVFQLASAVTKLAMNGCGGMTTEDIINSGLDVMWNGIGGDCR